jgi:hypothetical protein
MGAFEFFAQSLVKGIVGWHGRRTRYIRQQGSMSGVHPLLGSFDLFSRGHNDLSWGSAYSFILPFGSSLFLWQ